MAQQASVVRVKAKKMFKASVDGAACIMLNPGDVVEVDRFTAGMLIQMQKAEITDEKPCVNKSYVAPVKPAADQPGSVWQAIESLTKAVGVLATQKGR